jgi:AcrR family transcriptional regulator
MPRASLSEAEIAAFRRKAIRSATKLFARHGYESMTMRTIAADLRASPMTAYRYFKSKAEIFALVRAECGAPGLLRAKVGVGCRITGNPATEHERSQFGRSNFL